MKDLVRLKNGLTGLDIGYYVALAIDPETGLPVVGRIDESQPPQTEVMLPSNDEYRGARAVMATYFAKLYEHLIRELYGVDYSESSEETRQLVLTLRQYIENAGNDG